MLAELEEYDLVHEERQKENSVKTKMLDFMNGHYEKMRNENHLNDDY